ncbi:6-bladed beta-propeller [Parabacteroides sp. PF5-6]|uniref:6-bladed beta-propeller n=1 Tax=Parabacteroides sp. PF5-6 TaxID=1742403 RepID=UPI00240627BF|nr:6-bladed beta-propeller [Parabacteroides sp. PF5-6]MDF9828722.1 hypothetical protein [Parabacteroides sp. PF5-6]
MIKTYQLLFISGLFLILCGCKGEKNKVFDENSETPTTLHLGTIVKETGEEFLSTITSEIEYVALETTDEALVGNISRIARLKNGNLVIGSNQQLLLFGPTGKFLRPVSRKGNAPMEYNRVGSVVADPQTGGFFLLSTNKILEFDAQGNYVNHFPTTDRLMEMAISPEGELIAHQLSIPKDPRETEPTWFLHRYDRQGNEIRRYENLTPRMSGENIVSITTPIRPLYRYKGNVRFNEFGNDTVFTIETQGLKPYIILDLGEMRMSGSPEGTINERDAVLSQINGQLFLTDMQEDEHFFYMILSWGFSMKSLFAVYNKETGKATSFGDGGYITTDKGLTNDIDGGLPFFPTRIQADGCRFQWKTVEAFKEAFAEKDVEINKKKYGAHFEKAYRLAQSLDEDDNPVVIIVR